MSRKLHTKTGPAVYAARKGLVEPVIGQIKQARGTPATIHLAPFRFNATRIVGSRTTHNILKLYRLAR
jgi:hypothetical protein